MQITIKHKKSDKQTHNLILKLRKHTVKSDELMKEKLSNLQEIAKKVGLPFGGLSKKMLVEKIIKYGRL